MESTVKTEKRLLHTQEVRGSSPCAPTTTQQLTDTDSRETPDRAPVNSENHLLSGRYLAGKRPDEREIIRQLVEALKLTQWGNHIPVHVTGKGTQFVQLCPVCDQAEKNTHAPDCPVGAALENWAAQAGGSVTNAA